MTYTQIKIKTEYREKLAKLSATNNRSMANMVEVLIDDKLIDLQSSDPKPTQSDSEAQ